MNKKELKPFRPLPPIRKDETVHLDYNDVERINAAFCEHVRLLSELTRPPHKGETLSLITQGKEAANYLLRELNFADMDTGEGATAGIQQAHAELLDSLDKLGRAALTQPTLFETLGQQLEEARSKLPEGVCKRCFGDGKVLCGPGEYETCPECEALTQPQVDVEGLLKRYIPADHPDAKDPWLTENEVKAYNMAVHDMAKSGLLRTTPEKVEGFELDLHVKMWCKRVLNSINAALSDADLDDIEEHMRQCVEDWIAKFSQYDVLENAPDGWSIKIKSTGYEICDENGDSMAEHSSFEVAMTKAIDLRRTENCQLTEGQG